MTMHEVGFQSEGWTQCEDVLVRLPESLGGLLEAREQAALHAHILSCEACAEELAFAKTLRQAVPAPPSDLAARIVAKALLDPDGLWSPVQAVKGRATRRAKMRWGIVAPILAAATILLALGIGWNLSEQGEEGGLAWADAFDIPNESWGVEDWYVAGAPYLDGISDETLAALMQEVER